ncbi:Cof-type HAD-IIB family hydrolase [Enterococcus asini]|uniref:Cof-type HAD-IIB family hydrolase n=1 Tax=Enterococcus asini TaxID=57732 RepID=UPI00288EEAA8|nr:Cof-type HAD-IIB family hydrolase [Enterococcus asini]MDT2745141.1 Cof-type HAD-IIB family hydrolase [Enterococcus asini]
MTQKLIAIDLDGTTLNAQSLITPKTKAVLQETVKAGHIVSIATGRPFRMSEQFYKELGLTSPMVNFNGALVHLPNRNWSYESETLFSRDIVFDILAQKDELQLDYVAAENRDTFFVDRIDFDDAYLFSNQKPTEANLLKNLKSNPTSMLVQTTNEMADTVAKCLTAQYSDYVDVRTWGGPKAILEIVAKGIEKARGVKIIADALHIDRQNIMAFGDEHNDVEMLEYAGWGVAMANGSAGAKAAANDQTDKPNTEDGLADYLETRLLKKVAEKSA